MKIRVSILLLILAMTLTKASQASNAPDSTDIFYSYLSEFPFDSAKLKRLDTTLFEFQVTDETKRNGDFYNSLGNRGLAHRNLIYQPNSAVGFYFENSSFEKIILTGDKVRYYTNVSPYTSLYYVQAPSNDKGEEFFKAEHTQALGKNIFFGASFDFLNSNGFYNRQEAKNAHFTSYISFISKDKRYSAVAAYYHTRINALENGGLKDITEFTENTGTNRKVVDVNLNSASNLIKNGNWHLSHYYLLKEPDSTQTSFLKLVHTLNFMRQRNIYEDSRPNYNYYPNCHTGDESYIFDSVVVKSLTNKIALTNDDASNLSKILFEIGAEINYHNVNYNIWAEDVDIISPGFSITSEQRTDINYHIFNFIPYATSKIKFGKFIFTPELYFSVGNYNLEDYELKFSAATLLKKLELDLQFQSDAKEVPFMYKHLHTTTADWDNNFSKVFSNNLTINGNFRGVTFNAKYSLINNYAYLDQEISPQQLNDNTLHYLSAQIGKTFNFKRFDIGGKLAYQYASNREVMRFPDFVGRVSFIYKQPMFKKALMTNIGIDVYYNTPFYAEAYMPSIRAFYLQDEVKTGNYPLIDVYFRFQVKRARFFVEFVNVTSGLLGYNYIAVPDYPIYDRQFKYGVSWYFHD
jgi:hypothetical protein